MKPLRTFTISKKKDLLGLRTSIRQISRMLGLPSLEQAKIAAAVFELGCREAESRKNLVVCCGVTDHQFCVWFLNSARAEALNATPPRLTVDLSNCANPIAPDDVRWAMEQLEESDSVTWFDEMRQQNQELLQALTELARLQPSAKRTGKREAA